MMTNLDGEEVVSACCGCSTFMRDNDIHCQYCGRVCSHTLREKAKFEDVNDYAAVDRCPATKE